jgi:hypothetical protein
MNTLYYGDNLTILREYIKDESIDLIYLDPPFNSNRSYRSYNVLFKDESGSSSDAQPAAPCILQVLLQRYPLRRHLHRRQQNLPHSPRLCMLVTKGFVNEKYQTI